MVCGEDTHGGNRQQLVTVLCGLYGCYMGIMEKKTEAIEFTTSLNQALSVQVNKSCGSGLRILWALNPKACGSYSHLTFSGLLHFLGVIAWECRATNMTVFATSRCGT